MTQKRRINKYDIADTGLMLLIFIILMGLFCNREPMAFGLSIFGCFYFLIRLIELIFEDMR